jgi:hypothetical protein
MIAAHVFFIQKKKNEPIVIECTWKISKFIFNSALLNKLKYYPLALLLIIVLFGGLVYNFYRSTKIATQNKLGLVWPRKLPTRLNPLH